MLHKVLNRFFSPLHCNVNKITIITVLPLPRQTSRINPTCSYTRFFCDMDVQCPSGQGTTLPAPPAAFSASPSGSPLTPPTPSMISPTVSLDTTSHPEPAPCSGSPQLLRQYSRFMAAGSCNVRTAIGVMRLWCPCLDSRFVIASSDRSAELLCTRCSHSAALHNDVAGSSPSSGLQPTSQVNCKIIYHPYPVTKCRTSLILAVLPGCETPDADIARHRDGTLGMTLLFLVS